MHLYGSATPKRHAGWSNSPAVSYLHSGKLRGWKPAEKQEHKTYRSYVDVAGVKRYHGTKYLKQTATLVCTGKGVL